jgi:plastocyanin
MATKRAGAHNGAMSARLKILLGATVAVAVITVALLVWTPAPTPPAPVAQAAAAPPPAAQPVPSAVNGTLALAVTDNGFEPARAKVQAGVPLTLEITRKTDDTCATAIVIPDQGIQKDLPLNQTVAIRFTPKKAGELHYGCSHGQMIAGVLVVE